MRHYGYTPAFVFMLSLLAFGLHPSRVAAEPIPVRVSRTARVNGRWSEPSWEHIEDHGGRRDVAERRVRVGD